MPRLFDGGRRRRGRIQAPKSRMPYLVRRIKPNLIAISRLACSTLLSKILENGRPEPCSFGSRPGLLRQGVLELVAPAGFAFDRNPRHFCANFLNLSNFRFDVKPNRC